MRSYFVLPMRYLQELAFDMPLAFIPQPLLVPFVQLSEQRQLVLTVFNVPG